MGKWQTYRRRGGGGQQNPLIPPPVPVPLTANPVIAGVTFSVDAETDQDPPAGADGYFAGFSDTSGGPYTFFGPAFPTNPITSQDFGWADTCYSTLYWSLAGSRVSANSPEQSTPHP